MQIDIHFQIQSYSIFLCNMCNGLNMHCRLIILDRHLQPPLHQYEKQRQTIDTIIIWHHNRLFVKVGWTRACTMFKPKWKENYWRTWVVKVHKKIHLWNKLQKFYKRNNLGETSSCLEVIYHENLEDLTFSSWVAPSKRCCCLCFNWRPFYFYII
jgi:hypothetical protein